MPYVVTRSCCNDASCVVACPVNCIHPAPGEPGFAEAEMLHVDPATCVDCGACATACPVDAIVPHTKLQPHELPFLEINASYYREHPHADRTPLALVPPQRRLLDPAPVRVAVVGAGPAGLFTADELLKHPEVSVDVYDRLPTPYGLLRAGVAPDHQDTKRAEELFRDIESQPGFRYRLGVEVGQDVTLEELLRHHHAVVYAVGAAADRPLGVPGEDLPGSLSATDLVGWYNGHPDHRDLDVRLDCERVVVVGNGNVALDVARVLTTDPARLAATDIADHALAALTASRVREVVVLGRRGPAQAAFTLPELVGLAAHDGVNIRIEAAPEDLEGDDPRLPVLAELARRPVDPALRTLVLRFHTAPVEVLGTDRASGLLVARTELVPDENGVLRARLTDRTEPLEAGMVLRSVGYRGLPVRDLPHDPDTHTVRNTGGRVRPGVYVAGWAKRGPTGFIGTNKACARETVSCLLDDLDAGLLDRSPRDPRRLGEELRGRGVPVIGLAGWLAIDEEERERGASAGRPRRKIVDVAELERVAARDRRAGRYAGGSTR
ncbi:FAD-dependent oxidoreductase [Actinocorallia populi]|uniref:FAD-dependent oxidoreductase n=1 Tax=Actinocorallia populi TaxID=2079200 RepID=UPI000D08BB3B|nr:FAD-dependent oxidoreductase [Actinocorallia populi]